MKRREPFKTGSDCLSDSLNLIKTVCENAERLGGDIVLCGHANPDADSILSCVLMRGLLKRLGYNCRIHLEAKHSMEADFALTELGIDYAPLCGELINTDMLILLDHNAGSYSNRILLSIDHHPVISNPTYPVITDLTASSCTKMIYGLLLCVCEPTEYETEIALYSIACDTLGLTSTKTNPEDAKWFRTVCGVLGFDANRIIRAGILLDNPDEPPETLCEHNFKRFDYPSGSAGTSQVKTDGFQKINISALLAAAEQKRTERGYFIWNLSLCNPLEGKTILYWLDKNGVYSEKYDHTVSRTREIIPRLTEMSAAEEYKKQEAEK